MVSVILIAAFAALCTLFVYRYAFVKPHGWPPGPPRIPIFGSYLFLLLAHWTHLHIGALRLSRFYKSKIISLLLGPFPVFVVNSSKAVQEILHSTDFDGRPDIFLARMRDPNMNRKGIFFNDGPIWKEQRRFILRYLRDFGFGRRFQELELIINEQLMDMIDLIKNGPKYPHEQKFARKGQVLCPYIFMPFTTNSVLHVICNERYPRSEQERLFDVAWNGMIFQRTGDDYGRMLSIIPWIRHFFPNMSGFKPLEKANAVMYKFFEDMVERHIETYDESNERNFIDMYIKEMRDAERTGNAESSFEHTQFILSLVDFSFPAITAIGTQIALLMQHMLLNPEVQQKIQCEIDEVVGEGRLPCLDDRSNLHYTEATVREILRIETLVPSDVLHVALVDTELMGYAVPKGTILVPSLYAFHNDEEVWKDPQNFRPERFLDDSGKFCLKKDISLPFGAGKRLCAGETFARNMLFLIVSALCQNFNIVLGPGESPPDLTKNMSGIIISPPDYWVTLDPR